jgi:hypothetical protein
MTSEIVERALSVAKEHPSWPSLQVLDVAMEGHVNTHPDFEAAQLSQGFCDWLDPPSPFADLLRSAFGAHLDPEDVSCQSARWQEVIEDVQVVVNVNHEDQGIRAGRRLAQYLAATSIA